MAEKTTPKVSTNKTNNNNQLTAVSMPKVSTPAQGVLALGIEKETEIDGVGMGVLSDGTAFLTSRGLSRLCGVDHMVVADIAADWNKSSPKPRTVKIKEILTIHGVSVDAPYVAIDHRNGIFHAYPDVVCLAVLEYYALDAGINIKDQAKKSYRLLAGKGLHDFIYTQVGYDPSHSLPEAWKFFHDRVSLTYNSVPTGYFGIFKEMSDMIVTLGQAGVHIDDSFVPDISVGINWANFWRDQNLESQYGARVKYEHNYPDYFPQSASNPQLPWCYPEEALGEFRKWLREQYIGQGKFEKYLADKVRRQQLPPSFAQLAIAAYPKAPPQLT